MRNKAMPIIIPPNFFKNDVVNFKLFQMCTQNKIIQRYLLQLFLFPFVVFMVVVNKTD